MPVGSPSSPLRNNLQSASQCTRCTVQEEAATRVALRVGCTMHYVPSKRGQTMNTTSTITNDALLLITTARPRDHCHTDRMAPLWRLAVLRSSLCMSRNRAPAHPCSEGSALVPGAASHRAALLCLISQSIVISTAKHPPQRLSAEC